MVSLRQAFFHEIMMISSEKAYHNAFIECALEKRRCSNVHLVSDVYFNCALAFLFGFIICACAAPVPTDSKRNSFHPVPEAKHSLVCTCQYFLHYSACHALKIELTVCTNIFWPKYMECIFAIMERKEEEKIVCSKATLGNRLVNRIEQQNSLPQKIF